MRTISITKETFASGVASSETSKSQPRMKLGPINEGLQEIYAINVISWRWKTRMTPQEFQAAICVNEPRRKKVGCIKSNLDMSKWIFASSAKER